MNWRDFEEWLANPVTKAYFASLREELDGYEAFMLTGGFITADPAQTGLAYVRVQAKAEGFRESIEHEPEWAKREEEHENLAGTESSGG